MSKFDDMRQGRTNVRDLFGGTVTGEMSKELFDDASKDSAVKKAVDIAIAQTLHIHSIGNQLLSPKDRSMLGKPVVFSHDLGISGRASGAYFRALAVAQSARKLRPPLPALAPDIEYVIQNETTGRVLFGQLVDLTDQEQRDKLMPGAEERIEALKDEDQSLDGVRYLAAFTVGEVGKFNDDLFEIADATERARNASFYAGELGVDDEAQSAWRNSFRGWVYAD